MSNNKVEVEDRTLDDLFKDDNGKELPPERELGAVLYFIAVLWFVYSGVAAVFR